MSPFKTREGVGWATRLLTAYSDLYKEYAFNVDKNMPKLELKYM